jgi:hypothetical protein
VAERANVEWRESEPSAPGRRISEAEAMSVQSTRQHRQAGTFAVEQTNAMISIDDHIVFSLKIQEDWKNKTS